MFNKLALLLAAVMLIASPEVQPSQRLAAQEDPWSEGAVGTGLLLRRLDGVKRVLMIGAHPDDEDTALLATLSRGMGVETAYLSLTRGEGGQNLLGPELGEGLGIVRTGELLAARALDGGQQFFTRAFDFGFSKTAEETFRYWPREEVLADVTWVIRTFRPQVIVSVFSGTPADGHGQHQVAGIVAREAFEVAADPTRFPDQFARGASPWAARKLYLLTRRNPAEGSTVVETGTFDPLLGRSYYQVAMESRSEHRSQDMGTAEPMGPRRSTLSLLQSRVEVGSPDGIFSGIDTTLIGLAAGLPQPARGKVEGALMDYREAIGRARERIALQDPWEVTPALGQAADAIQRAWDGVADPMAFDGADGAGTELETVLERRIPRVAQALLRSAGVVTDVRVDRDLLVPGEEVGGVVAVWNGGPFPLRVHEPGLEVPPGWVVDAGEGRIPGSPRTVAPGSVEEWRYRIRVPENAPASRLYYLEEPRDGAMYRWPDDVDPRVLAKPRNADLVRARLVVQVAGAPPVTAVVPGHYRGVDKASGEFVEPILVLPAMSVTLEPGSMAWPTGMTRSREVTVHARNFSPRGRRAVVTLDLPAGWEASPAEAPLDLPESGAEASVTFSVTPPIPLPEGRDTIRARVRDESGTTFRESVSLVDYPHILRSALFEPARTAVSVFPVILDPELKVGYVMGPGDDGPEAIRQMGASVELLGPDAVRSGEFGRFDVMVLGIRAYETRPDLAAANGRLLDFARAGGTVVVQYNKYEFPQGGFAPYPLQIARPHDRVTDEAAPVTILLPDHPVFNKPNRIGQADFLGWVHERGLYFLREWDSHYTPLLAMADPGEAPKEGSLLVAPLGEGAYIYTGLAFFRQFPEGVPGAYRLFANLISLKGSELHGP